MQEVDYHYYWAKNHRNEARTIMKHVTSDAGINIAHDYIKDLKKTTALKNSCLDILIKIMPMVDSKRIKKHKFQSQTSFLEKKTLLQLAQQANLKSASNYHWSLQFQHAATA